jgi:hypothetical protein
VAITNAAHPESNPQQTIAIPAATVFVMLGFSLPFGLYQLQPTMPHRHVKKCFHLYSSGDINPLL